MLTTCEIDLQWTEDMPVFACPEFLTRTGRSFGWIGGIDTSRRLRCVLPYTVTIRGRVKMVRFRSETIMCEGPVSIDEERSFLEDACIILKEKGYDVIIPPTTNAIFRTFPRFSIAAPYGTYRIDLGLSEDALWQRIQRITCQNIKKALALGVTIRPVEGALEEVYNLVRGTFKRTGHPFMNKKTFLEYLDGLGMHGCVLGGYYNGRLETCVVYGYSRHSAYAIYGGNRADMAPGANKLLHWAAMQYFKRRNVRRYDFVGARIDPEPDSKAAGINSFKRRMGGELVKGYMWKVALHPLRSLIYSLAVRIARGGDIVDKESHKLRENDSG